MMDQASDNQTQRLESSEKHKQARSQQFKIAPAN
jgi:hypothetical protein